MHFPNVRRIVRKNDREGGQETLGERGGFLQEESLVVKRQALTASDKQKAVQQTKIQRELERFRNEVNLP